MPAEPIPSSPFPPPSDHNRPFILQDDQIAPVSQAEVNVSQTVKQGPERVIHDVIQNREVIQNEPKSQLNPCDTGCITNDEPRITRRVSQADIPKTNRRHFPLASRLQMRKDWIHGLGTIAKLALKYDIPLGTAQAWRKTDHWTAARNRWRAKQMEDDFILQPAPQPSVTIPAKSPLLTRIESQLEALDNFLDNANSPEDWQKLTNAKDKLLQNYYVLAGIAKPAARKAGKTSPARVQPIEPVEPGNV